MRWLFAFLAFINLFFFVWQNIQSQDTPIPTTIPPSITTKQSIVLLKERPDIKPKPIEKKFEVEEIIPDEIPDETSALVTEQEPFICLYLGGFTNQDQLLAIQPFLNQLNDKIETTTIKLTQSPKFLLYLSFNSKKRQETALEKLNIQDNIQAIPIPRGYYRYAVSMGIFPDKSAFAALQKTLEELGYPVKVRELPDVANSYWLKIKPTYYAIFTNTVLTDLARKLPSTQQELMQCQLEM